MASTRLDDDVDSSFLEVFPKGEIPEFLPYLLSQTADVDHLSKTLESFRSRKQYGLTLYVGEYLLKKINGLDAARHERQHRSNTLQEESRTLQAEQAKLVLEKAPQAVRDKITARIERISFELSMVLHYPSYLTRTGAELADAQASIAKEMIATAVSEPATSYPDSEIARKERPNSERRLKHVVHVALSYLESPEHILVLAQAISGITPGNHFRQDFLYGLLLEAAEKAKTRVEELKRWNLAFGKLLSERSVLEAEKEALAKIKQSLPDELEQRLNALAQEIALNYTGKRPHYDEGVADTYESRLYRAADLVLDFALRKPASISALGAPAADNNETKVDEAVEWAISTLSSPNDLLLLAKKLQSKEKYMHVQSVGSRVQSLVAEIGAKEHKINEKKERLAKLKAENEREFARWRVLPADAANDLRKLLVGEKVRQYKPSFRYLNAVARGNALLEVSKLMVHSVLEHFAAQKLDRVSKSHKLDAVLNEIDDPAHLSGLAQLLLERHETEFVLKFGEKGQERIKEIEAQREVRAPLVKLISSLEKEQQDLAAKNKSLTKEQQTQLASAQQQLESLPIWPAYAQLHNYHQYDELNLDIVRSMTSAILEDKVELEKRIAKLYEENDPASIDIRKIDAERDEIKQKIDNLVSITLLKFPNPQYLLRFAEDMESKDEADIVLRVGERCFERIKEYEGFLKDRVPLVRQIEHLSQKKATQKNAFPKEKADRLVELQALLDAQPSLPHFVRTDSINQYDSTKLSVGKLVLRSTAAGQRALEKRLEVASYAQDPRLHMSSNLIAEQRLKQQKRIHSVVELLERFVDGPSHLKDLLQTAAKLFKSEEPANLFYDNLVLLLAKGTYSVLRSAHTKAQEYDKVVRFAEILLEEKKQLEQFKKELPEGAAAKLKELSRQIKDAAIRDAVPLLVPEIEAIRSETTKQATEVFFALKSSFNSKLDETDDYYKQLAQFADQIKGQESAVLEWVLTYEKNPNLLTSLIEMLGERGEFDHAQTVGKRTQQILRELREKRKEFNKKMEHKEEIEKERAQLDKQRRVLPVHKQEELRELQLEEVLYNIQPLYERMEDYDPLFAGLLVALVNVCNVKLQRYEDAAAMDESLTQREIKLRKEAIVDESLSLLDGFFEDLTDVKTYINLASRIENKNTYRHIIAIGERAEDLIEKMRSQLDERSELELAHKTAEQKLISAKIMQADTLKEEGSRKRGRGGNDLEQLERAVEETSKRLKEIPEIKFDYDDLNRLLLQITELTIKAAKVEDRDDILLAQTILSFKADTTAERWDAVKNLCTESNWGEIKKELVVYVLKREDNPQAKIQLLMKDGLYRECLPIFPSPTSEDPEEVQLLLEFFKLVEHDQPDLLPDVVQIVQRYLKRYFQAFKFDPMDPLLDLVQRHYPALLVAMYTKATDMLLLNILPSQYPAFIKCLKGLKHRLCIECGKPEEWDNFSTAFKTRHAGKKRLIQMVSLIGDSSWDVNALLREESSGDSRSKSPVRGRAAAKKAKH